MMASRLNRALGDEVPKKASVSENPPDGLGAGFGAEASADAEAVADIPEVKLDGVADFPDGP